MPETDTAITRRLLLALLTALPSDVAAAQAALDRFAATASDAQWRGFVASAAAHGVLGVLLQSVELTGLPTAIAADLQRRRIVESVWHAQVRTSLTDAVGTLAAAGVPACALKGPVLAARLYEHPENRPSMDVDLLVSETDLSRAADALMRAGYQGDDALTRSYLLRHAHHLHFARPSQPSVELHFHAYAGFGVTLPAVALLARANRFAVDAQHEVMVPSPEDELLYLAVHAAGHSFVRLLWLFDLKLLLLRNPAVNWDAVRERAVAAGLAGPTAAALDLLRGWLACPLPPFTPRPLLRSGLANRLLPLVSAPSSPSAWDNLGGLVFTALLCDRAAAGVGVVAHHTARTLKRRIHRLAPAAFPPSWSA